MKSLSRYVEKTVAAATMVVLVGFIGLDYIFRVLDEISNMENNYTFVKVLAYEGMRTFMRFYDVMPIVGLIGCLAGMGALANTSELIVIRTAGVSTLRIIWMALKPALLFLMMGIIIGEQVAPATEQLANSYRAEARQKQAIIDVNLGLWIREGNDFIYATLVQPNGVMYGLNVFRFNDDESLESILSAKRAIYKSTYWQLEEAEKTVFENNNGMPKKITQNSQLFMHWDSKLAPKLLHIASVPPMNLKVMDLSFYINYLKSQKLNSTEYEIAFWQKMISLVLVGISFIFGPLRQVSMGYRVFLGILMGIAFRTIQEMLGPLSIVYGFPPILAMLAPPLFCSLLGLTLIIRAR